MFTLHTNIQLATASLLDNADKPIVLSSGRNDLQSPSHGALGDTGTGSKKFVFEHFSAMKKTQCCLKKKIPRKQECQKDSVYQSNT